MAKQRPSVQKRQREFDKRQRAMKKAEKAARKRERRMGTDTTESTASWDDAVIENKPGDEQTEVESPSPGPASLD